MSFFEANLAVLRRVFPDLAQACPTPRVFQGQWSLSRSGAPTVRRAAVALGSRFDPVTEADRAVPDWTGVDFAVLPGLGAGYLAEAVVRRYPDLPVLVAEPDPVWFAEVLVHRDLRGLLGHPRLTLLVGAEAGAVGRALASHSCGAVEVLSWRPLDALEPGWTGVVRAEVAQAQAQAGVNAATFRRFGLLWLRNLRKNEAFAQGVRPLTALEGWARGRPVVIAAAGPSLAERLDWMVRFRDRFVLVAVDTAWSALAARGLEPDLLVVLDGQYWNARHVDHPVPPKSLVVTEWIGPPRAFRLAPGRTFVAASSVGLLRSREEAVWGPLGALPSGGSVATAAWSLAHVLGASAIAFAGLDLGYPRGQTHVPGSQFEEAVHRRARRFTPAETLGLGLRGFAGLTLRPALDGGTVPSDPRMDLFRQWLVAAVASCPEVPVFNLGSRGSVIAGLMRPPEGFERSWPSFLPPPAPQGPWLVRGSSPPPVPPFSVLRKTLAADDRQFPECLTALWAAAAGFWGPAVWNSWAGRVKNTWDRYPSPRSRQVLKDHLELTLSWEGFWENSGEFEKIR